MDGTLIPPFNGARREIRRPPTGRQNNLTRPGAPTLKNPTVACVKCADPSRRVVGRGLCGRCHQRVSKNGDLDNYHLEHRLPFEVALEQAQRNQTFEGCWPWHKMQALGYSTAVKRPGLGMVSAHVASWVLVNGPIPDGLVLDHICHTQSPTCLGGDDCQHRRCVNPAHLEPVTSAENTRRRFSRIGRENVCARGHEWTEENTYWYVRPSGRRVRYCRTCQRDRNLQWRSKLR